MKNLLLITIMFLFTSCTSMPKPEGKPLPLVTFSHMAPLSLSVLNINVESPDGMNISAPSNFYPAVDVIWERYVSQRFQAFGNSGNLKIIMQDMNVVHEFKTADQSVAKFLNVGGQDQFIVDMDIQVFWDNSDDGRSKSQGFKIKRVINITEHASIAQREEQQLQGLEEMFTQIDETLVSMLRQEFSL